MANNLILEASYFNLYANLKPNELIPIIYHHKVIILQLFLNILKGVQIVMVSIKTKKRPTFYCKSFYVKWALTDSNRRPSACKADALNQLS